MAPVEALFSVKLFAVVCEMVGASLTAVTSIVIVFAEALNAVPSLTLKSKLS